MQLSPLQYLLIIAGIIFFIFVVDSFQRKRINALHFLVFFSGIIFLLLFIFDMDLLNHIGSFFGLNRGADLIVYISIIAVFYLYFEIINRLTRHSRTISKIVTEQAIQKCLSHGDMESLSLTQTDTSDFVFLIRCYNESQTIGKVIDDIIGAGYTKILIVNDGSKDQSVQTILERRKLHPQADIILLSHLVNRGGGAANKTGFEFLKRYASLLKIEWIVTFDADGQMDVRDMQTFRKALSDTIRFGRQIDAFLGSRFLKGGKAENIPLLRRIVLFGSRIITFMFNKLWVSDPHNGYRMLSKDLLSRITIESDNMTYASELLDELKTQKAAFIEVPVNIVYTEYSLKKGQKNSGAFTILGELIYKKFFFK